VVYRVEDLDAGSMPIVAARPRTPARQQPRGAGMTTPLAGRARRPTAPVILRQVRQRQRFGSSSGPYLLAALPPGRRCPPDARCHEGGVADRARRLRAARTDATLRRVMALLDQAEATIHNIYTLNILNIVQYPVLKFDASEQVLRRSWAAGIDSGAPVFPSLSFMGGVDEDRRLSQDSVQDFPDRRQPGGVSSMRPSMNSGARGRRRARNFSMAVCGRPGSIRKPRRRDMHKRKSRRP
jgi:hypothetical protein